MLYEFGVVIALAHALVWAATGIVLRSLSTRLDAFLVTGLRAVTGWLLVLPLALLVAPASFGAITPRHALHLMGSVVLGSVIGGVSGIRSMKLLGMARSFPITNSYPLFTMLFSVTLLGERLRWPMVPGAILALVGMYLVAGPRAAGPLSQEAISREDMVSGLAFSLVTAVAWGLSAVVVAPGLVGIHSLMASAVRLPAVALICLAAAAFQGRWGELRRLQRRTVWLLVLAGTMGYGVAATLYITAIQMVGPSLTSILATAAPVLALPMSYLFLRERPGRQELAGTALTVVGIALAVLP